MFTKKLTLIAGLAGFVLALLLTLLSAYGKVEAALVNHVEIEHPVYTVTGTITFRDTGKPAADVVVVSSAAVTAMTERNGAFVLTGLSAGAYVITPTYVHPNIIYTFDPISQTILVPTSTISQPFIADVFEVAEDFVIIGHITDGDGAALAGVEVTLNGDATTSTDDEGSYRFFPVLLGNYELRAAKSGYTFQPAQRTAQVAGNLFDQDFVGFRQDRVYLPLMMK